MKEQNILKRGYTTGSYVAASAKAGITFFETGVLNNCCLIKMPCGETEKIKFKSVKHNKKWIEFSSIKDSGDDPDITNGMEIVVRVKKKNKARKRYADLITVPHATEQLHDRSASQQHEQSV